MSRTRLIVNDIKKRLEPVRQWVDGDESQDPATALPQSDLIRSQSEEFMLRVAKEIDRVLREEFVSNKIKGTAYVPERFAVFLNNSNDKAWTGQKRSFLAETLGDIILIEAQKLCGKNLHLSVDSIEVNIRVDGTLVDGELYVRPIADPSIDLTEFSIERNKVNVDETIFDPSGGVAGAKPLYFIEAVRSGVPREMIPIYKREITIGRGSQSEPVDVRLEGEPRMSRIHACLRLDKRRKLWLTSKGTNPTLLDDRVLPRDRATEVKPKQKIKIYDFILRCVFRGAKRPVYKGAASGQTDENSNA